MDFQAADNSLGKAPVKKVRISRRSFLRRMAMWGAVPAVGGVYSTQIEPFWLDVHCLPMPLARLPQSFHGFRIAQVSDLHSGKVPLSYLQKSIAKMQEYKPDLVVITGDLVNAGSNTKRQIQPLCQLLSTIKSPMIAIFGNHEYGCAGYDWPSDWGAADMLEQQLTTIGCTVLRNRAVSIKHADGEIWIVGMDDLYSGRYVPSAGFAGVDCTRPTIVLTHNPDTAKSINAYKPDWILAGHTHGGQVRIPGIGAPVLPIINRKLDKGLFHLTNSTLYVTRGVGYVKQIRFNCRPELPIFELCQA